jgi:hypothetical protein
MAGVFINYRTVDNPLGAAGIHDALAARFGESKVFRDCVSLEAGIHYPAAIRKALADADVLVSIIGPQWLILTDDSDRRLIDRDHDWVRRELVWAHGSGTPILPVLLVDTPAHAVQPKADELPEDLRWFAFIQAVEFSQRRFGADLDRLATRIADLIPAMRAYTHALPQLSADDFAELVSAMEAVPCIATDDTRSLLVTRLRPTISGAIRHYPLRRAHVMGILNTCLNYEYGMADLIAAIANFEQPDSLPFQRLLATLHRLLPDTALRN